MTSPQASAASVAVAQFSIKAQGLSKQIDGLDDGFTGAARLTNDEGLAR